MAWEIADSDFDATDIVAPAGNGALLIGSSDAYPAGKGPRIHCVQSIAVQPLIRAIEGDDWDAFEARPTIASGISVSNPPRARHAAWAVVKSGGAAVAVSDEAMLTWRDRLASEVGIFCEVTSAAAFAGLEELVKSGRYWKTRKRGRGSYGIGVKGTVGLSILSLFAEQKRIDGCSILSCRDA